MPDETTTNHQQDARPEETSVDIGKRVIGEVLNRGNAAPLGGIGAIIALVWIGYSNISENLDRMSALIATNSKVLVDIGSRLEKVEGMAANRWTSQDMKIWELQLSKKNQTIDVPSSSEIIRDRTVP